MIVLTNMMYTAGWSVDIFFLSVRTGYQRSGMILEVQIQIFGARRLSCITVFIFKKFQGPKYCINMFV